jgi:PAS domain S-box-containing protein
MIARQRKPAAHQTERKRMEEALRRSQYRYRTLMEALSVITWSCLPSGLHVEPQLSWMAFTGQTAEEMLGVGWAKVVHPDDLADAAQRWNDAVQHAFIESFNGKFRDECLR